MNEALSGSKNRKAQIKILKDFLKKDIITKWVLQSFDDNLTPATNEAVNKCIDVLFQFIESRILDFKGMYRIIETHRQFMTDSQYLTLINLSERIVRDFLKIEELESKERYYQQETEFILLQGYILNERYIISFPDNPDCEDEEWVISEFRTGKNNIIRPVNGFKIKKNGEPYAKAQYISLGRHDESFMLTRVSF